MNALERARILCDSETIQVKDLPREVLFHTTSKLERPSETTDDLGTIQRCKVVEVLKREAGNKSKSARALGVDRRKLYRLLEKYSITEAELSNGAD